MDIAHHIETIEEVDAAVAERKARRDNLFSFALMVLFVIALGVFCAAYGA